MTEGHLDDVDPADIPSFEAGIREFARSRYGAVMASIAETGKLPEEELVALIEAYKASRDSAPAASEG